MAMTLTPKCHYDPEAHENETRCARCGRIILYSHMVIDEAGQELALGQECVVKMRRSGEIANRLPLKGRYDWKLSDVRESAYYEWYCSSVSHAV